MVIEKAFLILEPRLRLLSTEARLPFNNMTIRYNKTRWGSCSAEKNINLSCKLIFLPLNLVHHVLLHELCHTKHMNHGEKFWQLLTTLDPLTLSHRKSSKRRFYYSGWLI